ncbi:MAG: crotonase/enoyl-CoA hydratase family protein [Oleispira sp.]|nr:crotonase/enoyl-CoA hydratase family protein [Oleispira sp.]
MPATDILKFSVDNHIATIVLNQPETRNSISEHEMIDAIVTACDELNQNQDIRVGILTGAGSAFCSGGNVKDMRDKKGMFAGSSDELANNYRNGIQRIPLALSQIDIPLIAAVNGPAVGAGCDLTCMCDIRIASEKAKFSESFIKVGIIPGDGGAWFLPRIIGISRASQMALTGQIIDAQTAMQWNLVSEVVAHDDLLKRANALAQQIASNPPQVIRATKRLLKLGQTLDLPELLDESAKVQAQMHGTEDHIEAVNAFLEKRSPQFKGQ